MEELRLVEIQPEPKKKHWKLERTDAILRIFEEVKGVKYKFPYGMIVGMLSKFSQCVPSEANNFSGWGWVDEETGEVKFEIPPIEEFESQFRGFLNNAYAKNANYPLTLFFKQYGSFEVVTEKVPLKVKAVVKQTRVMIHCSDCKRNHYSDEVCQ